MSTADQPVPDGFRLQLDHDADPAFRAELGRRINAHHAAMVPLTSRRFTLALHDASDVLAGGLSGVMFWDWLFVEALWVRDDLRGQGIGRALLAQAETHAAGAGCHAVWLDTFLARGFYEALGYCSFGTLENYPPGQSRTFLRKSLIPLPAAASSG
jgi:GNAT superfamily N-acetyltransferase